MSPHPGDLAMIITPEQAALKAQVQFDDASNFRKLLVASLERQRFLLTRGRT